MEERVRELRKHQRRCGRWAELRGLHKGVSKGKYDRIHFGTISSMWGKTKLFFLERGGKIKSGGGKVLQEKRTSQPKSKMFSCSRFLGRTRAL